MSRCSTFADLSMNMSASLTIPTSLHTISQHDEDSEEGEVYTSSTCTVTETSSSATVKHDSGENKYCHDRTEYCEDGIKRNDSSMTNSLCSNGSGNVSAEFTIVCNGNDSFSLSENNSERKMAVNSININNGAICNGSAFKETEELQNSNHISKAVIRQDCDTKVVIGQDRSAVAAIVSGINGDCDENAKEHMTYSNRNDLDEKELTKKLENLDINDCSSTIQNECFTIGLENGSKSDNTISHDDIRCERVNSILSENDSNSSKPGSAGSQRKSSPNVSRQNSKHSKTKAELKKEAKVKSKVTLGPRYVPSSRECTIMSCLHQFTSAELLTGNNKFGCSSCTNIKYRQAPNNGM